jgi:glutathione S-transferase
MKLASNLKTGQDFFIWIRCNPLKSPDSAKGIQGNPRKTAWISLVLFGGLKAARPMASPRGKWARLKFATPGAGSRFHPSGGRPRIMLHPIILHHFDRSPFSEKIRVVFGHKGLSWRSVRIPPIMPKPDLMPLTGGYRRTPVMQIGADVFCDTAVIIREIERRFPSPTLFPPGAAGAPWALGSWTDRAFFENTVNLVFGALGSKVPQDFIDDRSKMRGAKFDLDKMRAAIPQMRDQMRAHLGWIEAQLGDGRKWLLEEFSLADASAYMNVWYARSNLPAEEDRAIAGLDKIFAGLKQVQAWESRMRAVGHGAREEMSAEEALAIARKASPETVGENDPDDPNGRKVGDKVRVAPDDYGKDEVGGEIVSLSAQHIAIRRVDERVGEIVVHFPRAGFLVIPT